MTYANFITSFRIILIPAMVLFFFFNTEGSRYIVTVIFIIAAITDYFDGYAARKYNQVTNFGKFIDPVADKILVVSSLLLILYGYNKLEIFIPVCIIILREVVISSLREWEAINSKKIIEVNKLGKIKTSFQLFAIGFLLFDGTIFTISSYLIGLYGIYIAAFLSLVSMIKYIRFVIKP